MYFDYIIIRPLLRDSVEGLVRYGARTHHWGVDCIDKVGNRQVIGEGAMGA